MKKITVDNVDYNIYENNDLRLPDFFKIKNILNRREILKKDVFNDGSVEESYVEIGKESEEFKIKKDIDLALVYTNIPRSILEDCYELVILIVNGIQPFDYEFDLETKVEKNKKYYFDGKYYFLDINYSTFQQWADMDLALQSEHPYSFLPIFMFKRTTQKYNRYERHYVAEMKYLESLPLPTILPIYLYFYNEILSVRNAFKYIYFAESMPPNSDITRNSTLFNKTVGWEKTIVDLAKDGYFNGKNGTLDATRNALFADVLEIINIQAGYSYATAWDYYETQERNKKKTNV